MKNAKKPKRPFGMDYVLFDMKANALNPGPQMPEWFTKEAAEYMKENPGSSTFQVTGKYKGETATADEPIWLSLAKTIAFTWCTCMIELASRDGLDAVTDDLWEELSVRVNTVLKAIEQARKTVADDPGIN